MIGRRDADLTACATLVEPLCRRLFQYVASAIEPVGRDQAAAAMGVTRSAAAFHLDKLTDAGALAVEYRRPPGRSGPGAGRPAKLYRVVRGELAFSVPERRYEVVAAVLARAVTIAEEQSVSIADALRKAARSFGRAMAANTEESGGPVPEDSLQRVAAVLGPFGYEPRIEPGHLRLANCPYHALLAAHGDVVCTMNLRLLKGVLKGADASDLSASRDHQPSDCCVTIAAR